MCGKVQRSREMPGIKELKSDSGYRTAQNQLHAGTTTTTQERNRDEVDALNHERRTKYHEARLLANKTACCIYAGVRTDSVQNETRRQFASGSGTPGNKNFPSYLGHGPGRSEKKTAETSMGIRQNKLEQPRCSNDGDHFAKVRFIAVHQGRVGRATRRIHGSLRLPVQKLWRREWNSRLPAAVQSPATYFSACHSRSYAPFASW